MIDREGHWIVRALWLVVLAFALDHAVIAEETREPIVVVVSKQNPVQTLSNQQLRNIFLRKLQVWSDGTPISVFERSADSEIRHVFARVILQQDPMELQAYWLELKMTNGTQGPKVCRNSILVARYLERLKGGIGYMYKSEVGDSLKIVAEVTHP